METKQEQDWIFCKGCRCTRHVSEYEMYKGERRKTCLSCKANRAKNRKKRKCPHGRRPSQCKDCDGSEICDHRRIRSICKECRGSQICDHGRIRQQCNECKGSSMCIHNKQKYHCKMCKGRGICDHDTQRHRCKECSSNPLKLTFKQMIADAKSKDKKYDRYDANNHIDLCFLEALYEEFDDIPKCYYDDCKCQMQYMLYNQNLITIERLDNSIGHIKSNCVFCCLLCNITKKSNKSK